MKKSFLGLILLGLFWLVACGDDKTLNSEEGESPLLLTLDSLRLGDSAISELNLDEFLVSETDAQLSLSVQCTALQVENPIAQVMAYFYEPSSLAEIASCKLSQIATQNDTSSYAGDLSFSLKRTEVGDYTLVAVAQDASGQSANTFRRKIKFKKNNTPPVLSSVAFSKDMLNVSVAPYADTLIVMASVSDDDGQDDIATVEAVYSGNAFPMYDDGDEELHGDKFLADGIYSRGFSANSSNSTGLRTFTFHVIDKSGDTSNTIEKSFYIKSLGTK
ncbi:hypothetical protein Ctha_1136 [Chloroherpeton thalassium ATCC 35110]|uniref:Lipoprotein n=1 Tax=Chloroherpeton thalassium (strain ATCC 35110 / GB-78) TaxID=517418 RepID=B3QYH2_CHLT3|nr:hypothetical protein [Chloroherpeton thalassium]ACF13600.1 hypothetical protein Ctha_1136 [Chloroherpeton thalassium ATCC 35110]